MPSITTYRSDGIGSTIQVYLLCYALAKLNNFDFSFSSFGEILNFDKDGKTNKEHTEEWNKFFSLKSVATKNENDLVTVIDSTQIMRSVDRNFLNKAKPFLTDLKKLVSYAPNKLYFLPDKTNVAIHVRQFVKNQDNDPNPIRRCYSGSNQDVNYYTALVKQLKTEKSNIHVFTVGEEKLLDYLEDDNVKIHYNESSFSDMYHMIMSDILVMANSSFSYVAHLLNSGETYVDRTFYHPTYESAKLI